MVKFFLLIVFISMFLPLKSQLVFHADIGVGSSGEESEFYRGLGAGVGYVFFDELHLFSGVNFGLINVIPPASVRSMDEDDSWSTKTVFQFGIYTGLNYNITLFESKEKGRRWGVFPEFRIYYNPFVPRKLKWVESEIIPNEHLQDSNWGILQDHRLVFDDEITHSHSAKGHASDDFGYSIGGGVFGGSWANYTKIYFEYNTLNPFAVIGQLETYPRAISKDGGQFIIRITFVGML